MALAWNLRLPEVSSVIIGVSSVAQLQDNLKARENGNFSADEICAIDEILDNNPHLILPGPS